MASGTRIQILPKLTHAGWLECVNLTSADGKTIIYGGTWFGHCECGWQGLKSQSDRIAREDMHAHIREVSAT